MFLLLFISEYQYARERKLVKAIEMNLSLYSLPSNATRTLRTLAATIILFPTFERLIQY